MKTILINKDCKIENSDSYAVCLGIFDGVHLGHKALMEKTVALAKKRKLKSAVLTFLKKGEKNKIYPLEIQVKLIEKMGIDTLFIIDFNSEFKNLSPESFIKNYLIEYIHAKEVICGFNFKFGKERCGTTETLMEYEKEGYNLTVIPPVYKDEEIVSSTLIKEYLKDGNIKTVNKLLGDFYTLEGTVKDGAKIGRTINFPTVNVPFKSECLPVKCGVYAAKIEIDGKEYKGISNVGYAPTVRKNGEIITETHILDFSGEVYNKYVKISLTDFIREEKKFKDINELKEEIDNNLKTAIKLLEAY